MKRLISCEYNFDNCCVELKFTDGSMIAIDRFVFYLSSLIVYIFILRLLFSTLQSLRSYRYQAHSS